jgi:hypothetical protein
VSGAGGGVGGGEEEEEEEEEEERGIEWAREQVLVLQALMRLLVHRQQWQGWRGEGRAARYPCGASLDGCSVLPGLCSPAGADLLQLQHSILASLDASSRALLVGACRVAPVGFGETDEDVFRLWDGAAAAGQPQARGHPFRADEYQEQVQSWGQGGGQTGIGPAPPAACASTHQGGPPPHAYLPPADVDGHPAVLASGSDAGAAPCSWEDAQRELRAGEVLVPLFHCLVGGSQGPRDAAGEAGDEGDGGMEQGAKQELRVAAVRILAGMCEAGCQLTNAQADWLVACCVRVHSLGWAMYDLAMEEGLLRLLAGALAQSSGVAASKHVAMLNKLLLHGIASPSASVRQATYVALRRCLTLAPPTPPPRDAPGARVSVPGASGHAPPGAADAIRPDARQAREAKEAGPAATAAAAAAATIIKTGMRSAVSGCVGEVAARLAAGAAGGWPPGKAAGVVDLWALAEALLLFATLAPTERATLTRALVQASVALVSAGDAGESNSVMAMQAMARLLLAGCLEPAHLQAIDDMTSTSPVGAKAARGVSAALEAAQLQLVVTRVFASAALPLPLPGSAQAAHQQLLPQLVLVRLRTCALPLLAALERVAGVMLGTMVAAPYAIRLLFHELLVELERDGKAPGRDRDPARPAHILALGRALFTAISCNRRRDAGAYGHTPSSLARASPAPTQGHSATPAAAAAGAWAAGGGGGGGGEHEAASAEEQWGRLVAAMAPELARLLRLLADPSPASAGPQRTAEGSVQKVVGAGGAAGGGDVGREDADGGGRGGGGGDNAGMGNVVWAVIVALIAGRSMVGIPGAHSRTACH